MRTPEEEAVNAYMHLFSSGLSLFAAFFFIIKSPDTLAQLQFFFLGLTGSWAFFTSFLYHNSTDKKKRESNLILDRVGIYVLICGTGISFALTSADSQVLLYFCITIIAASSALILAYCMRKKENEVFSLVSYLLLGWFCMTPGTGLMSETIMTKTEGIYWLIAGMGCYSSGVVFYVRDSKKWAHTAWHALVMLGYACCLLSHAAANNMLFAVFWN